MRRAVVIGFVTTLLGVALVQERQGQGAALEISTEPAEALVNVTGPQGFMAMLDLPASETLTGLPPGRYYIVATADGHAVAQEELELAEGAQESVSLQMQPLEGGEQAGQADESQDQQDQPDQQAEQQDDQQAQDQQQDGQQQDQQAQQQDGQQDQVAGGGQAQGGGQDGQQAYQNQCAQCHGQEGEGGTGPALAGNQDLQDPQMVIDQILQGGGGMPSFSDQLSDEEIAAIATHELNSWGNSFGEVTPDDVSQQRDGGQAQDDQQQDQQQQDQQAQGQQQQDAQVEQDAQQTRVEITVPSRGAPVTVNVQVEVGAAPSGQAGQQQPAEQQQQQENGQQQQQDGEQQDQQQDQQQDGQQQDPQEDQQAQQQDGQQQDQQAQQQNGQQQDRQADQQQTDQRGWFSETQAQSGIQSYVDQCAACHGGAMEGRPPYPPVAGDEFLSNWEGQTLRNLFDYISEEMPDDRPGELDEQTYVDMTAYILQQNGFPAGEALSPRSTRIDQLVIGQEQAQEPDEQEEQQEQAGQQDPALQQDQQSQQQDQDPEQAQQQNGQQNGRQPQEAQQPQQEAEQQDQVAGGGQAQQSEQGQEVYDQQCAQCHGQEGEGGTGPALGGNQSLQDPETVVNQIVQGGGGMPAFGDQLSDEQIAAVATHEMNSWGNEFGEVGPDQVSQGRDGGQEQPEEDGADDGDAEQQAQPEDRGQDDVQQGVLQIDWIEPSGATVNVSGPEDYSQEVRVVGGEVLTGLPAGTYTVTASHPGFESSTEEVEIEPQSTTSVTLDLR